MSTASKAWILIWGGGMILSMSLAFIFETHTYTELLTWYDLPKEAYQYEQFTRDFFPEEAYEVRKWILRFIFFGMLLIGFRILRHRHGITLGRRDWSAPSFSDFGVFLLACSAATVVQWQQFPAYDEVFTSYYILDGSPWHAWSYYMLPNNHSLFSVIGSCLSFGESTVYLGRGISIFFFGLGCVAMFKSWRTTQAVSISWAMLLCALCYFPLIGMAGQSRGYALLWCISWWVFWYGSRYLQQLRIGDLQRLGTLHVFGFLTMPSYLYIFMAVFLWLIWSSRDTNDFWKSVSSIGWIHMLSIGITVAWMSPLLAFSGYESLTSNKYVALGQQSLGEFTEAFLPIAKHYLYYAFFELPWAIVLILWVILAYYHRKEKQQTQWVDLGIILIVSSLCLILFMKKWPFHRNLIVHFTIFYLLGLGGMLAMVRHLAKTQLLAKRMSMLILLGIFSYQFSQINHQKLNQQVYFDDSEHAYRLAESVNLLALQHGADSLGVSFSDQSFYPAYLWTKELGKKSVDHGKLRVVTRSERSAEIQENRRTMLDSLGHYYLISEK